jgi:predicted methyltransferase
LKTTWRGILLIALAWLCSSVIAERSPLRAAPALPRAQARDARRDAWQRPEEVMDALGITAGSAAADVGCGDGYFVMHLAHRVGARGAVYAEDVEDEALSAVRGKVEKEKLANVRVIHGTSVDPQLPESSLDAILVVNAYHEFLEYDAMMKALLRSLKPGGRLGIIDAVGDEKRARAEHQQHHTITEKLVMDDAARNGFHFRGRERGFQRPDGERHEFFFLIFERPAS